MLLRDFPEAGGGPLRDNQVLRFLFYFLARLRLRDRLGSLRPGEIVLYAVTN
jgi:hypothetical protein